MPRILIDSSGLIVFLDRSSNAHQAISSIIGSPANQIILPASVIPEVSYVIATRMGHAVLRLFIRDLVRTAHTIENLVADDYARIAEVLQTYADLRLDFVDASVLALAERLGIQQILTLDRRDFSILRPRHCEYLELLP
jgi:hypothetical protein